MTYRALWRWHFHAGLFCIPFVLVLALTGSIYLFKPQIDAFADRGFDSLILAGTRASAEAQIAAALASVPGSLLIARFGVVVVAFIGLLVTALAAAARSAAFDIWTLYVATVLMGFGIAILQPSMPTLVRAWTPNRMWLATAIYTNGMLIGVTLGATVDRRWFALPAVVVSPMVLWEEVSLTGGKT